MSLKLTTILLVFAVSISLVTTNSPFLYYDSTSKTLLKNTDISISNSTGLPSPSELSQYVMKATFFTNNASINALLNFSYLNTEIQN